MSRGLGFRLVSIGFGRAVTPLGPSLNGLGERTVAPTLITVVIAHGIGGRADLPVPIELVLAGAGVALLISFFALGVLWKRPRLQDRPDYTREILPVSPRPVLQVVGVISLLLVVGQLAVPLLGLQRVPGRPTIAPVMVWVVFWLVVPFLSAFIGNWYADLNPWRTVATLLGMGRFERMHLVGALGLWPASAMFVLFVWLELIHPGSGSPITLAGAASVLTLVLLVGMTVVGRETGLQLLDPFTTYNRLFSAISPLGRSLSGQIVWRGWLRSLAAIPQWKGLWFFLVVMIGTVTYDGASGSSWFQSATAWLGDARLAQTWSLLLTVGLVGLVYLMASWVASLSGGGERSTVAVAQRFAHTLVPIALAYVFAHYFTLIIFEGQQLVAAVSDPFGIGWDLFGTADRRIKFWVRSTDPIWYTQVATIVGGHILGVILAHDRALADFGRDALRSQYAMLVLMISLTSLGLLVQTG